MNGRSNGDATPGSAGKQPGAAERWLRSMARQVRDTYRLGVSSAWTAPAIFALIVLPEFAQHVYEIKLGMFEAGTPMPVGPELEMFWRFAYVKVAALLLGMLLIFRFWMRDASLGRTFRTSARELARLILAVATFALFDIAAELGLRTFEALGMAEGAAAAADAVLDVALFVPRILLLLWLLAAIGGVGGMTAARSARIAFPNLARFVILLSAAFVPPAAAHQLLHVIATGANPVLVWTIMVVDSLVVGLIGTLVGSALYVIYRDAADESAQR